jgi:hypothetical protein
VLQCTKPSLGTKGGAAAEKMQVNMTQALVTDFHMLQPGNLLENHCGLGSIQPIQKGGLARLKIQPIQKGGLA